MSHDGGRAGSAGSPVRAVQIDPRKALEPVGTTEKLDKVASGPPLGDLGGSFSYSFVYIEDFCKPEMAASY